MTITTETTMLPVDFVPPLLNPSPGGLYAATNWTEESGAPRWLAEGVALRGSVTGNYGGDLSTGIWGASWCAQPDDLAEGDLKDGVRPSDPAPFVAVTTWGFDQCDLTSESQAEAIDRAQQVLRMREPAMVASEFATRIKADAGTPTAAPDLVAAVGEIEAALADTNTLGYVHIGAKLLAPLVSGLLAQRTTTGWKTPAGHTIVIDGGYTAKLGSDTLVATSAPFGWRTPVEVIPTTKVEWNQFVVIAERSALIGVERVIDAVKITPVTP